MTEVEKLANMDRICGVSLNRNDNHQISNVKLRYIDKRQLMSDIDVSLDNAMYLLYLLESMKMEESIDRLCQSGCSLVSCVGIELLSD